MPEVKEFVQSFFHGTRAELKPGDLISPGYDSNYVASDPAKFVYLTSTLHVAIWGAELARRAGIGRIYVVEPTGALEDDPNLTDQKFPGNPTRSFRARDPLRVQGEVTNWQGHAPEEVRNRKERIAALVRGGARIIE